MMNQMTKNRLTRIYIDKCMYSPFDFSEFVKILNKKHKFTIVANHGIADIIVSSYMSVLKKYISMYQKRKKYLLWTHEPYHDFNTKSIKTVKINNKININVNIMNVYTQDVFTHNYRYFYFNTLLKPKEIHAEDEKTTIGDLIKKGKKVMVALSTYQNESYYKFNPQTLLPLRYKLIEEADKMKTIDVYGKGWDKHKTIKSVSNSRHDNDRRDSKQDIVGSGYIFNICPENADAKWYVTEKIWESIAYGTLPIYKGSTATIGQCFAKDSYINIDDYETISDLFKYIENMTIKDCKERYNMCVASFNGIIEQKLNNKWRGNSKDLNINYLEYKTCFDRLVKKLNTLK